MHRRGAGRGDGIRVGRDMGKIRGVKGHGSAQLRVAGRRWAGLVRWRCGARRRGGRGRREELGLEEVSERRIDFFCGGSV